MWCPECGKPYLDFSGPTDGKRPMVILHTVTCRTCGHEFEHEVKQVWATDNDRPIDYRKVGATE